LKNRSPNRDAMQISVDPFETNSYRAAPSTVPLLWRGDTQALSAWLVDKRCDISFIDIDLAEMLKDTSDSFNCSLQFALRYQDSWGNGYARRVTIESHRIALEIGDLPPLINHPIERNRENLEDTGTHRLLIPLGETTTKRPVMAVDKRSGRVS
jgi:hypothetical protein